MKDIVVIGAGILGASTAYHLAKAGAEVTIIDRKDKGQATDAAAGIVCPWISQRRNQAWYKLAKAGARYYSELIPLLEKEGETNTGYARVGAISLHSDNDKLQKMIERAIKRREDAPEIGEVRLLTASETKALFPPVAEMYSSVYISGAARVDGRALRESLLQAAKRNGAKMILGSASLELQGSKVTGVKVDEQVFNAKTVIVTNGAWAPQLLEPLGIPLQVEFQKGQIIHMHLQNADTSNWPVVMPPGSQYIVPFNDGKIVAGATNEKDTGFDIRVTAGSVQSILQNALTVAPGLADSTIVETRVGFRPFTPGFLPVIGALPDHNNIIVANGLGSSGLTVAPFLGLLIKKIALKEQINIDLESYSIKHAL
ncbi:MAG TPA: FAD-dependent oxidoreductase [Bacillaceae bacterium]|nr:FAD-dependent oxidoreductase [Paenibacillus bovis]HLU23882.1 FAD-dependent oxidoreductase [Bacillaceae bacterium]